MNSLGEANEASTMSGQFCQHTILHYLALFSLFSDLHLSWPKSRTVAYGNGHRIN